MVQPIISIKNLSKSYQVREPQGMFRSKNRTIQALNDVTLTIQPGELFGLLGPNGAGKTTLMKCLTTLLLPSSGTAFINGYDLLQDGKNIRASIGCMLMGERGLYWKLTGRENLLYFAALYFITPHERRRRVDRLIERLEMSSFADRPVESYSSGQKMKLAFAKALVNDAPILFLDEPGNALDVHSARELRALVRLLHAEGRTIIYTSHLMTEVEALCTRIAVVDHGTIIAHGSLEELKQRVSRSSTVSIYGAIPDQVLSIVRGLSYVSEATLSNVDDRQELIVQSSQRQQILPTLLRVLVEHDIQVEHIQLEPVTLEDIFVQLTQRPHKEEGTVASLNEVTEPSHNINRS